MMISIISTYFNLLDFQEIYIVNAIYQLGQTNSKLDAIIIACYFVHLTNQNVTVDPLSVKCIYVYIVNAIRNSIFLLPQEILNSNFRWWNRVS